MTTKTTTTVQAGLEFQHTSAEALYEMRVLRPHRDFGFWECVFLNGPRKGAIWVRSERGILHDVARQGG